MKKQPNMCERRAAAYKRMKLSLPSRILADVPEGWLEYVFVVAWNKGQDDHKRMVKRRQERFEEESMEW